MTYSEQFLREAIRLAGDGMEAGAGGPFGAVIVLHGAIVGRGWNRVTSANDPTAHAEVEAIRDACTRLGRFSLEGCEIYASCEPCPMCLAAIYWARLDALFYAASRSDAAGAGFDDALIWNEMEQVPNLRALKMEQYLQEEGGIVLKQWRDSPDKVRY